MGKHVFNIHRHNIVQQISRICLSCTTNSCICFIYLTENFIHIVEKLNFQQLPGRNDKFAGSQISKPWGKVIRLDSDHFRWYPLHQPTVISYSLHCLLVQILCFQSNSIFGCIISVFLESTIYFFWYMD